MSTQDDAALARAVFEAFNDHDPERAWIAACSDASVEVVEMFAGEEGSVMVEFVGRGTHDGPLASPGGEIPPTGRSLEPRCCEMHRMRVGKIASARLYYDAATPLGQPGLMPQPEGASS